MVPELMPDFDFLDCTEDAETCGTANLAISTTRMSPV